MRPIDGTITDPASDARLDGTQPQTPTKKQKPLDYPPAPLPAFAQLTLDAPNPDLFDTYQDLTDETAVYPRVYTEDQVRLIVADVLNQLNISWTPEQSPKVDDALSVFEEPFNRLVYPILGLVGEAGELANKLKKVARDNQGSMSLDTHEAIQDELGDVLWYVARVARECGKPLGRVAKDNITKLFSRKTRGVLGGSGDNR